MAVRHGVRAAALASAHARAAPCRRAASFCRAEFRVWHEGDDMYFLMYEKDAQGKNRDVRVDTFPVASGASGCRVGALVAAGAGADGADGKRSCPAGGSRAERKCPAGGAWAAAAGSQRCSAVVCPRLLAAELLNELMGLLRQHIKANDVLRKRLFQVGRHGVLAHRWRWASCLLQGALHAAWLDRMLLHQGSPPTQLSRIVGTPAQLGTAGTLWCDAGQPQPSLSSCCVVLQANFHTTLSGQSMISLIYHKKLDDEWKQVGCGPSQPPLSAADLGAPRSCGTHRQVVRCWSRLLRQAGVVARCVLRVRPPRVPCLWPTHCCRRRSSCARPWPRPPAARPCRISLGAASASRVLSCRTQKLGRSCTASWSSLQTAAGACAAQPTCGTLLPTLGCRGQKVCVDADEVLEELQVKPQWSEGGPASCEAASSWLAVGCMVPEECPVCCAPSHPLLAALFSLRRWTSCS